MEMLANILPIVIYILLIGLIIISIIIGIKIIITMNKVEKIIDNVEDKVNSLNGIFHLIEVTSGKITGVYEKIVGFITGLVEKIMIGKKKEREEDEEDE